MVENDILVLHKYEQLVNMFFENSTDHKVNNQVSEQIKHALRYQISQLADPMNRELQNYWNWHPNSDGVATSYSTTSTSAYVKSDGGLNDNYLESIGLDHHNPFSTISSLHRRTCIELALDGNPNNTVEIEVIVSDLHDRVIESCRNYFGDLNLPVTLMQEPMQAALLKVLHFTEEGEKEDNKKDKNIETFVIFGGYGNGMINSGLQKQLFDAFPNQMNNLRRQALDVGNRRGCQDEHDINMINQGEVFLAQPSLSLPSSSSSSSSSAGGDNSAIGGIHFISCATYPRKQSPSEEEHIRTTFHKGLELALSHFISIISTQYQCHQQHATTKKRKIRILTHAMGSFVGHDNPAVFAWGLAHGLNDLLLACGDP